MLALHWPVIRKIHINRRYHTLDYNSLHICSVNLADPGSQSNEHRRLMLILSEQIASYALSHYRINVRDINVNFEHGSVQGPSIIRDIYTQRCKIDVTIDKIQISRG